MIEKGRVGGRRRRGKGLVAQINRKHEAPGYADGLRLEFTLARALRRSAVAVSFLRLNIHVSAFHLRNEHFFSLSHLRYYYFQWGEKFVILAFPSLYTFFLRRNTWADERCFDSCQQQYRCS